MQASTLPSVSEAGDGRHLAAIVFADLVGYSRLMAADEVGTHTRWSGFYDAVVKPEAERHGGRIKDLRGDGVLIEFASVLNTVKWARSVHAAAAATGLDGEPALVLRVAIHMGEVLVTSEGIFGDAVYRALAGTCCAGGNRDFGDRAAGAAGQPDRTALGSRPAALQKR